MKLTGSKLREMIREIINEVSPPGWGGTVKAMKKHKKDIDNPWALAWHMKGKGDKPHYKDEEGSPKKYKKYKYESVNEAREIGGYYLMKQLKDLAHDAKRNGEGKLNKALMYLHSRINQSYRDIDLSSEDVSDLLADPRGRKHSNDIPTWMIDDLFEGKINEGAKDKVYVLNNMLWLSYSPNSGQTTRITGRGYLTDKRGDKNYDSSVPKLVKWANSNKPVAKKGKQRVYKIPRYARHETDATQYDIWGGETKPQKYLYMLVASGKINVVAVFYSRAEAMSWVGHTQESVDEAIKINIDDLLKNKKVKEIMKRLGIKVGDAMSTAKIIQHFMRNPSDLKAIGA